MDKRRGESEYRRRGLVKERLRGGEEENWR